MELNEIRRANMIAGAAYTIETKFADRTFSDIFGHYSAPFRARKCRIHHEGERSRRKRIG